MSHPYTLLNSATCTLQLVTMPRKLDNVCPWRAWTTTGHLVCETHITDEKSILWSTRTTDCNVWNIQLPRTVSVS